LKKDGHRRKTFAILRDDRDHSPSHNEDGRHPPCDKWIGSHVDDGDNGRSRGHTFISLCRGRMKVVQKYVFAVLTFTFFSQASAPNRHSSALRKRHKTTVSVHLWRNAEKFVIVSFVFYTLYLRWSIRQVQSLHGYKP
jgi:hypothetical protein